MTVRTGSYLLLLFVLSFVTPLIGQSEVPKNGYVPDEATAVRIAEAVFTPIYGAKRVHSEGPFRARLEGDHWVVQGTLPKPKNSNYSIAGGTMMAEINRMTGRIQAVYHMK
jgi:hypothetical protein